MMLNGFVKDGWSLMGSEEHDCRDYEDGQMDVNITQELSQQVSIVRFVSDSIGRGIAKAWVEMEMEAQMDSKNFEIA